MTELNRADKIIIGGQQASAVYIGATKAWPVFRPITLSGCAVWIDASKLTMANGAAVSSLPNLGIGSQPIIAPGAICQTNALNALPVLRITQGSGRVRWYSGTGVDKDYTLVYVGRRWKLSAGRVITSSAAAANILVGFHGNEMDVCHIEGWITSSTTPPTTLAWKLYSVDSTSTAVARFFVNGTLFASGAATPAKGWGGSLFISGYSDDAVVATSQECDCEIAELVMYNRKLTDVERQQVEGYLRVKWGV